MKNKIFKLLSFFMVISIAFLTLGCHFVLDPEELIPTELGEPEGLFVYYNNYRSLTDGSQKEEILKEIVVGEETYSIEECEIFNIRYFADRKEIFYAIKTERDGEDYKYVFVKYNYDKKTYTFIKSFIGYVNVFYSDYYICVRCGDRVTDGAVFDLEGNLIADGLRPYFLYENVLYDYSYNVFYWWKDGKEFSINLQVSRYYILKDYAYLFTPGELYIVNLNTGETVIKDIGDEKACSFVSYKDPSTNTECGYVITYASWDRESGESESKCWKLSGFYMEHVYTFDPKYEVSFYGEISGTTVYITMDSPSSMYTNHAKFDVVKGEIVRNYLIPPTINTPKQKSITVGEYYFYVDTRKTDTIYFVTTCYYLHRVYQGKDEIVQYWLNSSEGCNPVDFDDIHVR